MLSEHQIKHTKPLHHAENAFAWLNMPPPQGSGALFTGGSDPQSGGAVGRPLRQAALVRRNRLGEESYLLGEVKQMHPPTIPAISRITPRYTPGGTEMPSGLFDKAQNTTQSRIPENKRIKPHFLLRHLPCRIGSPQCGHVGAEADTCCLQVGHSISFDISFSPFVT